MVNEMGKGAARLRQVGFKEMSVSEPPMTYRKDQSLSKPESPVALGQVHEVPGPGVNGNRYIGGMTLRQALVWNVGTCCLDAKGKPQAANTARANTDARRRGGVARSSDEAPVMGVERRGNVVL